MNSYISENQKSVIRELIILSQCNKSVQNMDIVYEDLGNAYFEHAPKSIYKYYQCKQDRDIKSVFDNKLGFSRPVYFNDCFDCELFFDENKILQNMLKNYNIDINSSKAQPLIDTFREAVNIARDAFDIKSKIVISCFSETDDNRKMGKKYANDNSGLCVKYDVNKILTKQQYIPLPVLYNNSKIKIHNFEYKHRDRFINKTIFYTLTTKETKGQYEHEGRLAYDITQPNLDEHKNFKGVLLDFISPSQIVLGHKSSNKLYEKVRIYCEQNQVDLYKMSFDKDNSQLKKKPLSLL